MGIAAPHPSTCAGVDETGCCAVPTADEWDRRTVEIDQWLIGRCTRSMINVQMSLGSSTTALNEEAQEWHDGPVDHASS